jgi:hypothetical protein
MYYVPIYGMVIKGQDFYTEPQNKDFKPKDCATCGARCIVHRGVYGINTTLPNIPKQARRFDYQECIFMDTAWHENASELRQKISKSTNIEKARELDKELKNILRENRS